MNRPRIQASDDVSTIIAKLGAELGGSAGAFALLARFRVNEEAQDKVAAAFAEARAATLREAGCIAYELHREAGDPARLVVYERWRSLTDLEAHLRTPHVVKLRGELDALIVGAPEFATLLPA